MRPRFFQETSTVHPDTIEIPFLSARSVPLRTEDVYRLHAERVARWALSLGGPEVDAEEIVQDVFSIIHQKLPGFHGTRGLISWMWRITENVVHRHRKRDRGRRWLTGDSSDVADKLPPGEAEALDGVGRSETRLQVYAILDRMKERHRTVLILYEIEGLTTEEIARLQGVRLPTVWVWLHRARAEFVRRFEVQERSKS